MAPKIKFHDAKHAYFRAASKKFRQKHPERDLAWGKRWRKNNPGWWKKYERNREYRETDRVYALKRRWRNKEILVAALGGECLKCGYNKCIQALEFHHKEPSSKKFMLSSVNILKKSLDDLHVEAAKCLLLCANCHRELHFELRVNTAYKPCK